MKSTLFLVFTHGVFLGLSYVFMLDYPIAIIALLLITAYVTFKVITKKDSDYQHSLNSLIHGLQSLRDNDFSVSLNEKDSKHAAIFHAFNQTSEKLRNERQHLYQREMLLDKVLNASPMVTILVDQRGKVIFTNTAAQQTFNTKDSILGMDWQLLVSSLAPEFQSALNSQGESIFTLTDKSNQQQAWHVTSSHVQIHQASHQLYILKTITQELSKQEVETWKKVISVISHELNNSIAPISSMCHSGELLAKNLNEPRLNRVFNTISGRVNHLNDFIKGYASLTKVKLPQKSLVDWPRLLEQLQAFYPFTLQSTLPTTGVQADVAQLEQVLINILKNAHEADPVGPITLSINQQHQRVEIEISDNGSGMSQEVIQNALLPFYSTKHSGTGLGLALCREIIEAHQGKLIFNNKAHGGLSVLVVLPSGH
ncbi:histidine kinase [Alteromonadales bacterium alter-6D02]|nr:histidine kinase [Alteromonadales bacterium alter-6D02]